MAEQKQQGAGATTADVAPVSVVCHTLGDFQRNPTLLREYADPHGYVRCCDADWLQMVASNPYMREDDLLLILTLTDKTIVGRLGLHPGLAHYLDQNERTYWLDGFFLEPSYLNTGAGGRMLLAAISFSPSLLACGAPSTNLQKVYRATGFVELGPLTRYVYFYNPEVIAKKLLNTGRMPGILSPLARLGSPLLRAYYKVHGRSAQAKLRFTPSSAFQRSLDALFDDVGLNFFPRDHKILNWALQHQEDAFGFEVWRGETLAGYCILKQRVQAEVPAHHLPEMSVGTLLDYWLDAESQMHQDDLVQFCIDFFQKRNVDVLEIQASDPKLWRNCARLGMIALGGNRVFFRPGSRKQPLPLSGWFLTHGTADVLLTGR